MNRIWIAMIVVSLVWGLLNGNVDQMNEVLVQVGESTLNFVLPLLAVTCFFNGIVEIAKQAGCLAFLERCFHPFLKFLLPDLKDDRETLGYVASNIIINMFGLGSAATPAGLKAIQGMQRHNLKKDTATRSMVTFPVLNTGGVTLFPTTIIAMRSAAHSLNVTNFLPFAIIATLFASFVGLLVDRWWNHV